jgi:predicted phage terminase large subunit-like protein
MNNLKWDDVYMDVAREVCRESFEEFVKQYWPVIIGEKLQWNWHMKVICDEMQRVAERVFAGKAKEEDLIVNVPPGTSKPVWEEEVVNTSTGAKKLKEIVPGDYVLTHLGRYRQVTHVWYQGEKPCKFVRTLSGHHATAEHTHPFLTSRGWKEIKDLKIGMELVIPTGDHASKKSSICDIKEAGTFPCRCLTVDEDHSFTVNGIAVHNSSLCSIMFPAWCWTRMPSCRLICASYSHALSLSLSIRCRDLVKSEMYTKMFGVEIRKDQDAKNWFKISGGGERYATSTNGSVVGFHAHIIIIDDPINLNEVFSPSLMDKSNTWLDQSLLTRKVSKEITPFVLIQQSLSESDPSGYVLQNGSAIRHVCLPAEENDLICPPELRNYYVDGLLDQIRMPKRVLDRIRVDLGEYAYAGQFLQSPHPIGCGLFQADKIQMVFVPPSNVRRMIRYWDKAVSTDMKACYTAGVKMGILEDGRVIILDVVRGRWAVDERERIIRDTAVADGVETRIFLEKEPGSGGAESATYSIRNLAGFSVEADAPKGDKALRADPFASMVNSGNILAMKAEWNNAYLHELTAFPVGKYKDQVDASSGCFNKLVLRKRCGAF